MDKKIQIFKPKGGPTTPKFNDTMETAIELTMTDTLQPWWMQPIYDVRPATASNEGRDDKVDSWYKFQVPWSGKFTCHGYSPTRWDGYLELYRFKNKNVIIYDDNSGGNGQGKFERSNYTPGEWLYIRECPYNKDRGDFQIQVYGDQGVEPPESVLRPYDIVVKNTPITVGAGYGVNIEVEVFNRKSISISDEVHIRFMGVETNYTKSVKPNSSEIFSRYVTVPKGFIGDLELKIYVINRDIKTSYTQIHNIKVIKSDKYVELDTVNLQYLSAASVLSVCYDEDGYVSIDGNESAVSEIYWGNFWRNDDSSEETIKGKCKRQYLSSYQAYTLDISRKTKFLQMSTNSSDPNNGIRFDYSFIPSLSNLTKLKLDSINKDSKIKIDNPKLEVLSLTGVGNTPKYDLTGDLSSLRLVEFTFDNDSNRYKYEIFIAQLRHQINSRYPGKKVKAYCGSRYYSI